MGLPHFLEDKVENLKSCLFLVCVVSVVGSFNLSIYFNFYSFFGSL